MRLKHYLEQGMSKAELSRRFGVSRRTIHEWIETGQLDRDLSSGRTRYASRPRGPLRLDPYKGIIEARLGEFPKLSAQRLFDEVRAAGYPGGYSRVRDYVRQVRPREPAEAAVRFETPPGRQGQVDFGTFTLPWGRRHALVVVLGHSRLLWLRFYRRQTIAVLIDGLESAFARFGGVPAELLFDQLRAVVLSDDRAGGGELVLNAEFLRFAAHWGFVPRSCRPYRAHGSGPCAAAGSTISTSRPSTASTPSTAGCGPGSKASTTRRPTAASTARRPSTAGPPSAPTCAIPIPDPASTTCSCSTSSAAS